MVAQLAGGETRLWVEDESPANGDCNPAGHHWEIGEPRSAWPPVMDDRGA